MIVISDTSPICYLVLIGYIDVLPALFGSITIPHTVKEELQHPMAAPAIHQWTANSPTWFQVRQAPETSDSDLLSARYERFRAAS